MSNTEYQRGECTPTLITGETVSAAWEKSITVLLGCGSWTETERGLQAIEGINFTIHIPEVKQPIEISKKYCYRDGFIDSYKRSLEQGFAGVSVGSRLYDYGDGHINQLEKIIRKFRESTNSRRCVISLWNPAIDYEVDHPPCNVLHQFLLRNGTLGLTSFFRSNDAWMAALPDMVSNCSLLKLVSDELGVSKMAYTHIAHSYHIYESDFSFALETTK
ncbi:MAG: thymidylate synthase [Candidatus Accumulibacter necessarius]|jgi:thymidylate synthase|uniref:thymidylate synthase n=1 Tax=Candidatus Accumulibacter necessarius TaxID=2954386 RepID=UPI002FC35C07